MTKLAYEAEDRHLLIVDVDASRVTKFTNIWNEANQKPGGDGSESLTNAIDIIVPNSMHSDLHLFNDALEIFKTELAQRIPGFINETANRRGYSEKIWRVSHRISFIEFELMLSTEHRIRAQGVRGAARVRA